MTPGVIVPGEIDDVAAFAARAESYGYDAIWTGELWGRDAFVTLMRAATATDRARLGTAVVNVYGRTPATLAQAAATLDDASGSRAMLGLGTSTPDAVEGIHGVPFENPPRRLHETAALAKQLLDSEGRVTYDGECVGVSGVPPLGVDVPVYTAALGPATRRATGRTADGWLPHNIPFDRLDDAFETVAKAAREAGRDPEQIRTAPWVPAAVSEDPTTARRAVRGHLAYYVGSGEGYRRAVGQAFPDAAETIAEAWRSGDRDGARAAVTDRMVAALGVAGTPSEGRDQFADIAALDRVDEPIVVVPNGTSRELRETTVEALAPDGSR